MQAHPTTGLESSSSPTLFRTTQAHDSKAGQIGSKARASKGHQVFLGDQVADLVPSLFPTPRAQEPGSTSAGYGDGLNDVANRLVYGFAAKDILLMTPTAVEGDGGAVGEQKKIAKGHYVMLRDQVKDLVEITESGGGLELMPTPTVGHVRNHDEPVEDYLQRRQDFIDGKTKGMPGASLGVAVRMEILNDDVVADSDQKGL
jgi:hypothetical protein